jgi:prolyl-tRNA synthetase
MCCIEATMQNAKALQASTSHDLGQNIGKAFNETFQSTSGEREHIWATGQHL